MRKIRTPRRHRIPSGTNFEKDGKSAVSKWVKFDSKWYYFDESGHMATGKNGD